MEDHIVFHRDSAVLDLLDQRKLPASEERFLCRTTADVITALQVMVVRGAPAIGVSAAFGCASRPGLAGKTQKTSRRSQGCPPHGR